MLRKNWNERLEAEAKKLGGLEGSIQFGYDSDEAGGTRLYKVNAAVDVASGTYPQEIRFRVATSVIRKGGELAEEVARTLLNYDYHFSPRIEGYGFGERFSDNYMSMQQRYEIGSGIKLEWESRKWTGAGDSLRATRRAFEQWIQRARNRKAAPDSLRRAQAVADTLTREYERLAAPVAKKYSQFQLGLAFSVFSELEQVQIESPVDTLIPGVDTLRLHDPVRVAFAAPHQWRGVLRPSFTVKPMEWLTLRGSCYLKYPLSQPHRIRGRLDYRADTYLDLAFKLNHPASGNDVSIVWKWEEHYDNTPPEVPQGTLQEFASRHLLLIQQVAEKRHRSVQFAVELKL